MSLRSLQPIRGALSALALSCIGLAAGAQSTPGEVRFPELRNSYLTTGDFIGPDHVRRIRPGLNKDQVRLELGNPHFNEGIFGVTEWDYAFNFYTGKGSDYVTCQFKVRFDEVDRQYKVASTHWKAPDCERYLDADAKVPPAMPPVAIVVPPPAAMQRVTLASDGLFAFAKSGLGDLQLEGRRRLEALAVRLKQDGVVVTGIDVVGHTDRIGSEKSNEALSLARAQTVRAFLQSRGVDAAVMRARGAGESQPVVQCAGDVVTPALVACLQPNRRVTIDVAGQK